MVTNLEENFKKLKEEGSIKGDYSSIEKYLELKKTISSMPSKKELLKKSARLAFFEYKSFEVTRINEEYFKDEYHTINHWIGNYVLAKEYYRTHGHLLPFVGEVYEIHDLKFKIDDWVTRQRVLARNKQLRPNQIKLLNEIGMVWKLKKRTSNYVDNENKKKEKIA